MDPDLYVTINPKPVRPTKGDVVSDNKQVIKSLTIVIVAIAVVLVGGYFLFTEDGRGIRFNDTSVAFQTVNKGLGRKKVKFEDIANVVDVVEELRTQLHSEFLPVNPGSDLRFDNLLNK